MLNWTRLGRALALTALIGLGGSAFAAEPAEGDKQPTQGKPTFSMDQFENSLWTPQKKKTEKRKSEARHRKIAALDALITNPSYPNKADAMFRLAETHWKEAKYKYFLERETYDAAFQCFEEKRCAHEPTADEEPTEDYSVAIGYYRKVLLADPNYPRLDQVTYYLGRAAIEAGKATKDRQLSKEGEDRLKDVVQKFPKSRYVPDAHLTLAEYYFDKDSLYYAKTNYEKIIQNFPTTGMFNYALYKLGWVYFNLAEFEKTVDTFKRVIASIKDQKGTGVITFRDQALNDLIQAFVELDGGWRTAKDYFLGEVGEEDTYVKLDKMAGLLVTKDRDDDAVELYRHLIGHDKVNPTIVEYFDALLEVHRKIGDMDVVEKEVITLTDFLDKKGQWATANKGDAPIIESADDLMSTNLSMLANHFHRSAQKLQDKRKNADVEYNKAAKYYSMFLDRYPNDPESYKYNFYYAEILFDEKGEYMAAAEQYEKVLDKDQKGEFVEDAALGVVYAMESELDKQGIREKVKGVKTVSVSQDLRGNGEEPEIEKTDLHPLEARMIRAADRYVAVITTALKDPQFAKKFKGRGKMVPNMMYIAAQMFYSHGQFEEAVTRLQVIFDHFPKSKMAHYAVNIIIDAYKRLKRWKKIEFWARELIKKRNFTVKKKPELELIIAIAKTENAKDLTRQRKYDEAVQVQQEIVDEFGRKNREIASKALFNIGAVHEIARRWPEAVAAYEDVIKRYKDMEVAVDAQSTIGILYENQTKFREAAEAFVGMQQFRTRFKNNPAVAERAAIGYRNAGVLYEALEEYDKAYEVFSNYTKVYKKRQDVPIVAFQAARVLEYKATPESRNAAGKAYTSAAKKYGRKDKEYGLRANAAAGLAYKAADKVKNRRKAEKLFKKALKQWAKFKKAADKSGSDTVVSDPATKGYAALIQFELAEYKYDDYTKLSIDALNRSGRFDMRLLGKTLEAKGKALLEAKKAFEVVLDYQDKGMAAAAAFRMGQTLYEFAESLFDADVPPGLSPEEEDEYRFALEDFAAPLQEQALAAFTAALKQAVKDGVYNKWSRMSAVYAAKVNKDEFPIAEFTVKPDKTQDTIQSTSFIVAARRGSVVVDYLRRTSAGDEATAGDNTSDDGENTKEEEKEGAQ